MGSVIVFAKTYWIIIGCVLIVGTDDTTKNSIRVEATLSTPRVLPGAPFVVRCVVKSGVAQDIDLTIDPNTPSSWHDATLLVLTSASGRMHRLGFDGRPHASMRLLPVRRFITAGTIADFERVFTPLSWGKDESTRRYGYRYVEPGTYSAIIAFAYSPGRVAQSDPFVVEIFQPTGDDTAARAQISTEIAAFMCGGEPPSRADGEKQQILDQLLNDHPNSRYAEWIRYWDVYYDGSVDEALNWSRAHRDSPLADNLLLHKAERLFDTARGNDRGAYDRVRQITDVISQDFPDGDTRMRAERLKEKTTRKP